MRFLAIVRLIPSILLLLSVSGCMPAAGPKASAVTDGRTQTVSGFSVITLNASLADLISNYPPIEFPDLGRPPARPPITIGIGDTVVVTIFEAAAGGLFSTNEGQKSISLPAQIVAADGTITVPYVGAIRVAGRMPSEVKGLIEAGLKDKAIEPQVLITVSDPSSTSVTVIGDVAKSGRFPLNTAGNHLLDVIAAAGGPTAPAYETYVRITRGSRTGETSLATIVSHPAFNMYLVPGDEIFVSVDPEVYTILGATGQNGSFQFQREDLTLAEALGRAGGLNDNRANPAGVFLFRYERPEVYERLFAGTPTDASSTDVETGAGARVIYRFNMKDPDSYFATQRFMMRDDDVIFVSNAPSVDLEKFLNIIRGGTSTANSTRVLSNALTN